MAENDSDFSLTGSISSDISTSNRTSTSNASRQSNLHNPFYFGNVTLEMIDDFLNPISKNKSPSCRHMVKYMPPPVTSGVGLRNPDESEYDRIPRARPNQYTAEEFDYIKSTRAEFERELRNQAKDILIYGNESTMISDDHVSVVGSAMSQIESVSTMNMSTSRRKQLMKGVEFATNNLLINEEEDESMVGSDMNNNTSRTGFDVQHGLKHILNTSTNLEITDYFSQKQEHFRSICKVYDTHEYNHKLPITALREEIVENIRAYKFCIIQGGTGCGKTTQVPQFILDSYMAEKKYCNIIVTQPRRIAAMSVARRVCNERDPSQNIIWHLGGVCGYQIGLDRSNVSNDTFITYVTTGVLLQKLIGQEEKDDNKFDKVYTHIILDEVHERDLDTDFVLLLLKIKSYRNLKTKVILMSATIDTHLFQDYLTETIQDDYGRISKVPPILIKIPSTIYQVKEYYWDDLVGDDSFLFKPPNIPVSSAYNLKSKLQNKRYTNLNDSLIGYNYLLSRKRFDDKTFNVRNYESYMDARTQRLINFKQQLQKAEFDPVEPNISQEAIVVAINLLKYFDQLEVSDYMETAEYKDDFNVNEEDDDEDLNRKTPQKPIKKTNRILHRKDNTPIMEIRGSVLIFVPGMFHIQTLIEAINKEFNDDQLEVLPLHSDIVIDQQKRVFEKRKEGIRKVIISTSIAESSITVPDVKYVIDFGLTKELFCDTSTNYTHLRLEWASKSSMNQRRGRAGRVSNGMCFRLVKKEFFETFENYTKPAILREPLSRVILNTKRLNQTSEPKRILSMAIQPPRLRDIERTCLMLKEVGALSLKCKNSSNKSIHDGDLTYVGSIMANLPIDVHLSKLILLGHTFGKLPETIIIASCLSNKTFFTNYFRSHLETFKQKLNYSSGYMCDCLTMLSAYNLYESSKDRGLFETSPDAEKQWAKSKYIELGRLREVVKLKDELTSRLEQLEIRHSNEKLNINRNVSESIYNIDQETDIEKNLILKMIIAGAFYPNYFVANKIDLEEANKLVNGKSILNTVQIKNLPCHEGILYNEKIRALFKPCADVIQVHYEDSKGFVEFKTKNDDTPTNVNLGVHMAIQMRLIRLPLRINKFNQAVSIEKLRSYEQTKQTNAELEISVDENRAGPIKFTLHFKNQNSEQPISAHTSDYEKSSVTSHSEHYDSDESSDTIKEESDEDNSVNYGYNRSGINLKSKNKFSSFKFNSTMSLEKSSRKNASLNTSAKMSLQELEKCTSIPSLDISYLNSNRMSSIPNMHVQLFSNPFFILPKGYADRLIEVTITHVVECGHFWAQVNDSFHNETVNSINNRLNQKQSVLFSHSQPACNGYEYKQLNPSNIQEGTLCVSHFELPKDVGKTFYRAKIVHIDNIRQEAHLQFVDYGMKQTKAFSELFELSQDLSEYAFQAFECKLANVKLSPLKNPNGKCHLNATKKFVQLLDSRMSSLRIQIENIKANVLDVSLIGTINNKSVDFGKALIESGYMEKCLANSIQNFSMSGLARLSSQDRFYIPISHKDIEKQPHYIPQNTLNYHKNVKSISSFSHFNDTDDISSSIVGSMVNQTTSSIIDNDENYCGTFEIKGPFSPLEVSYHSTLNVGRHKKVKVEPDSINACCLDDDPTNDAVRLMIASSICLSSTGDTMLLRKTCLMPKLPGLVSICTLLYAPTVEFRVDKKETKYIGALCGLGFDEHGPIFHDDDIECTFDVNIDLKDITLINAVRLAINLVIGSKEETQTWTNDAMNLKNLQQKACNQLLTLINRHRELIEPKFFERPYKWNQVNQNNLIPAMNTQSPERLQQVLEDNIYFNYHKVVALSSKDDDDDDDNNEADDSN